MSVALKLETSASFHAIAQMLRHGCQEARCSSAIPAATSIAGWVMKVGYACLTSPKPKSDDWIVVLDESVNFGAVKLLVIYGVQLRRLTFERPLQLRDLTPLWIQAATQWTGETVFAVLASLQQQLGRIRYAIADYGPALKKALRLAAIPHVYDLTHAIAAILTKLYAQDPIFQEYTRTLAHMRTTLCLSAVAEIVPPNQRVKSRFLNLDVVSQWGMKALQYLAQPRQTQTDNIHDALAWVQTKQALIEELATIHTAIRQLASLLKTQGLSSQTIPQCQSFLTPLTSGTAARFKEHCHTYFAEMLAQLPTEPRIACSSDVIETAFGKYKNYLSHNPMTGFTPLALCLAAFTSSLRDSEVQHALEQTRMQDVHQWAKTYIGETVLHKRGKIFHKNGAKNVLHPP